MRALRDWSQALGQYMTTWAAVPLVRCLCPLRVQWVHVKETTEIGEGKLFAPGNLRATFDNPAYGACAVLAALARGASGWGQGCCWRLSATWEGETTARGMSRAVAHGEPRV